MDIVNEEISVASISFSFKNHLLYQSGLLIDKYIITTGGILLPFIFTGALDKIDTAQITVSLQNKGENVFLRGFIVDMWQSVEIKQSLTENNLALNQYSIDSFSYFFMISTDYAARDQINKQWRPKKARFYKGIDILVVSTPYGCQLFLNSYTKGIISNVLDQELFIIDARLSFGSEGGPVYQYVEHPNRCFILLGMVLIPFMIGSEYTGFSLCCSYFSVYQSLCRHRCLNIITTTQFTPTNIEIDRASDAVLPVTTPTTKGSCILLNENGFLITCGHVIKYDINMDVEVEFKGRLYKAKVLCCATKDDILDLAFLQIYPDVQLPACKIDEISPVKGKSVYLIGYESLYGNIVKMVSKGTILKCEEHSPLYISCMTNWGNSGGGVFGVDGNLLAIVFGVMLIGESRIFYRWHGVCIPVSVILKTLHSYYRTGDLSYLQKLCMTKNLPLLKWKWLCKSKL